MEKKYLLGYDIGSSSVKAALIDAETGELAAHAHTPSVEMEIDSPQPGFAEQHPEMWWKEVVNATKILQQKVELSSATILGIGITYQMHGLVCVDRKGEVVMPSIIWCDSRATKYGEKAIAKLGENYCLSRYLNSPGNFTASKLKWVQVNQPELYKKIDKFMLPGDYIAFRMTGRMFTTVQGLSEAVLWNFKKDTIAYKLLEYFGIDDDLIPEIVNSFGQQGVLAHSSANELGLSKGIPVCYRSGDQPNNAFALKVIKPGEVAANAGTSGVIYGISDKMNYDPLSRVNLFAHVNHSRKKTSLGVLLCVNGTGSMNSWLRKNIYHGDSYDLINTDAATVEPGADGLSVYPFGNGAERILENNDIGASFSGLQLNRHSRAHMARAVQEGIVFALAYGMEIMHEMGTDTTVVKAGLGNMFQSDVFKEIFVNTTGTTLELYDTDGAAGAARAAGVGCGWWSMKECYRGMNEIGIVQPTHELLEKYKAIYGKWKENLPYSY